VRKNLYVIERAKKLNEMGFSKFDSLHIACAIAGKCEYFLTTDDRILSYASRIAEIKINDPIGFIKEIRI